jgi:hypothetical protein
LLLSQAHSALGSINYFLLRDLRLLAEIGRCKALPADVVLHIIASAIGRGRQKADLLYDDLGAAPALASPSVDPRARSQRALDIELGSLASVIVQVFNDPLEASSPVAISARIFCLRFRTSEDFRTLRKY